MECGCLCRNVYKKGLPTDKNTQERDKVRAPHRARPSEDVVCQLFFVLKQLRMRRQATVIFMFVL